MPHDKAGGYVRHHKLRQPGVGQTEQTYLPESVPVQIVANHYWDHE